MESPILAAAAGAAAMLLLVALVLVVTRRRRSRRDLEAMLDAAQRETDALRHRLQELTGHAGSAPGGPAYLEELFGGSSVPEQRTGPELVTDAPDFVITHVGDPDDADLDSARPAELVVPDRLVLSATLGEPLVKVAAFSHGVRRALSAESRNRIWFEMRREVRASRRRRRQLRKRLERDYRARLRATDDLAEGPA
jgi:hypothetical protein